MSATADGKSLAPCDWMTKTLKRFGSLVGGSGFPVDEQGFSQAEMEIPFFKVKDLQSPLTLTETDNYVSKETAARLGATVFPQSTIVFAKVGAALLLNRFRILGREGCIDNNMMAFQLMGKHDVAFFRYVLDGVDLSANFNQGPVPSVNTRQLGSIAITAPQFPEQKRIAAYLDASCAAIDAAVAAKRRQLETLDALRKTVIHRAVTQGLNSDVEMQTTDVEWIPVVPKHWRVARVKDVLEFHNTIRVPLSAAERGVMTARTYDYYGASGVIDKVEDYHFDGTYILIAEDGANLLTRSKPLAFLASGKFWVNNHAHILKPRWGDDTFFVSLLEAQDYSLFVTGAAQPKLTMENLGRYKLAVPPLAQQQAIAAFIREKDAEFRPLFAQIERQIETLVAYRKSLIHECVTGQRRVTEEDLRRAGRAGSIHAVEHRP